MKKTKGLNKIRSINQFQFQLNPISIIFNKKQSSSYIIYFQKGAQVLGKINQQFNGKERQHKFANNHSKKFRITNDKTLVYQWSIYRLTQDQEQQYFQTVNFCIKARYQQFIQEFQKIQDDLYRIYSQKQKKTQLQQIWKDLRKDLTKNEFQLSCLFSHLNVKISFKIYIKSEYDFMYDKYVGEKQRKKFQQSILTKRKNSVDSRNKSHDASFVASQKQSLNLSPKQKNGVSFKIQPKKVEQKQKLSCQGQEQSQDIRQSQIRITNPEGVDVTGAAQVPTPQKFAKHVKTLDDDYYIRKKSSYLSDIIEYSNEDSSNINLSKANQQDRLKSVDQIQEVQQPLYSPLVKTQTYESPTINQMFSLKRTATLRSKGSQNYDLEQENNQNKNKTKQENHELLTNSHQKQQDYDDQLIRVSQSDRQHSSFVKSSEISKEQEKQRVDDLNLAKLHIFKNIGKILLIVAFLIIVVNVFNIFGSQHKKDKHYYMKRKTIRNQSKHMSKNLKNK